MKRIQHFLLISSVILVLSACSNTNSKSNTWSDNQKAEWKENCEEFLITRGVDKGDAKDFCDCMLEKTADKYTPEEAKNITEEQEQEIWQACDYQW